MALKVSGAFPLNGEDAEDLVRDDHEDEVEDPDDVPAQEKAQDPGEDLPFHKARDEAAHPRSDGDDRQDHADEIVQAEIVFFGSHDSPSFFDTTIVLFGGGNVNLLTKKAVKIFCGRRGSLAAKSFDICARIKYNVIYLGIIDKAQYTHKRRAVCGGEEKEKAICTYPKCSAKTSLTCR